MSDIEALAYIAALVTYHTAAYRTLMGLYRRGLLTRGEFITRLVFQTFVEGVI